MCSLLNLLEGGQYLERLHFGEKYMSLAARVGSKQHLRPLGGKARVNRQVLDTVAAAVRAQHPWSSEGSARFRGRVG